MNLALIGKSLGHSFSSRYFTEKFAQSNIDSKYSNIELASIDEIAHILSGDDYDGFNVTIPYKEQVMPYLDEISEEARNIGAVNTIVRRNGRWEGFNTDYLGVIASIAKLSIDASKPALILGSGGASKSVQYALKQLNFTYQVVSRNTSFDYHHLEGQLANFGLLINTTPLGTFPKVDEKPNIPYSELNTSHVLFDLVYNPEETAFMKEGQMRGCQTLNGRTMLIEQAERAYDLWLNRA